MEIPGLSRLQSPPTQTANEMAPATEMPPTVAQTSQPNIDPGLEARIAAMRAQIKEKETKQLSPSDGASTISPATQDQETPALNTTASKPVNFSVLDEVLARHGMESVVDSDDDDGDDDEVMREEDTDSDTSSYISSSDSDSDSDSVDQDSAQAGPLTAEERERILIEADNDGPMSNDIPRTKNEVLEDEEPVQVPDFVIEASEPIEPLGIITSVVGKACVVTGAPTPETKVLDIGSLLVFEDRKNLGFIADTFGPVILPMFSVRFNSAEELVAAGVELGKQVFVASRHATYVFSETLRIKGTDASNIHDEEQSETEFSDDEQEAIYKSQKKQQRRMEKNPPSGRVQRQMNDLESIAMAQGMTYDSTQNQIRPSPGHDHRPVGGPQQSTRGAHASRNTRGRGRGRPETNNFGRGPYAQEPAADSLAQTSTKPYQRQFYQPDAVQTSTIGASLPTSQAPVSQVNPALYEPLKRPS